MNAEEIFIPFQNIRNNTYNNLRNYTEMGQSQLTAKMVIKSYREEYLPDLKGLNDNQETYNYRILFAKDIPLFPNPLEYSYLPVFQEGYAVDTIENGRALITWGVGDCVIIALYNPMKGIYMTHSLYSNSFSKRIKTTAYNFAPGDREVDVACQGKVIQDTFPPWIREEGTQFYLFSNAPYSLFIRIKQIRLHGYTAPILAYCGMSWDGRTSQVVGVKKTRRRMNIVMNDRLPGHMSCFAISSDGLFGIPFKNSTDPIVPSYLKSYMTEFEQKIKRNKSPQNRRCIYKLPPPASNSSTPPPSPKRWENVNAKSRRRSRSVSPFTLPRSARRNSTTSNPFSVLNSNNNNGSIGGKRRKTRKNNRR